MIATIKAYLNVIIGTTVALAFVGLILFYEGLHFTLPVIGTDIHLIDGKIQWKVKEALAGYVALSEKTALQAQLAKVGRDRDNALKALAAYAEQQAADDAAQAAREKQHAIDTAADSADDGAGVVTQSDLDWLPKHK
jgi:multidrug efflux pump subunit AcrA (membrane-fusion protein)